MLGSISSLRVTKLVTSQFLPRSPDHLEGRMLSPKLTKGPMYCHLVRSLASMAYKKVVGVTSRMPPEMMPKRVSSEFRPSAAAIDGHELTNGSRHPVTSRSSGSLGRMGFPENFCHVLPLSKDFAMLKDSLPTRCGSVWCMGRAPIEV